MAQAQADIAVTLTGLDETVSQTVHARHYYLAEKFSGTSVSLILLPGNRTGGA
jgi:inward rectifier potassium channel